MKGATVQIPGILFSTTNLLLQIYLTLFWDVLGIWYECLRWRSNMHLPGAKIDIQLRSLLMVDVFQDCPWTFQDSRVAFQDHPGAFGVLQDCWVGRLSCNQRFLRKLPSIPPDWGWWRLHRRRQAPLNSRLLQRINKIHKYRKSLDHWRSCFAEQISWLAEWKGKSMAPIVLKILGNPAP